jgi:hypothetical protein
MGILSGFACLKASFFCYHLVDIFNEKRIIAVAISLNMRGDQIQDTSGIFEFIIHHFPDCDFLGT